MTNPDTYPLTLRLVLEAMGWICEDPGVLGIPLRDRDEAIVGYALIDEADVAVALEHRWGLRSNGYVAGGGGGRQYLHRLLLGLERGDRRQVDHINGDALNNRRSNLRVCTRAENQQNRVALAANNTSGFRGVSWSKRERKWEAYGVVNGKRERIGVFATPESAGIAAASWRTECMPFSPDARMAS